MKIKVIKKDLPLTFNNGMETPINIVIDHDNSEILKFFIKIKKLMKMMFIKIITSEQIEHLITIMEFHSKV